jgi:DnaJ-class molecular chaperone
MFFSQDELERMRRKVACPACDGKGYHCRVLYELTGQSPTYQCDKCDGTGRVMRMQVERIKASIIDL